MTEPARIEAARIEAAFDAIAQTRMAGLPLCNPALGVAVRGWQKFGGHGLGVLVTPWCMNLLAFPTEAPDPRPHVGASRPIALPSGSYPCLWMEEDSLGGFWSCSLFSPMAEFPDMATALATADAVIAEVLAGACDPLREDWREAMVQPGQPLPLDQRLDGAPVAIADVPAAPEADRRAIDRRALFGLPRTRSHAA